MYYWIYNGYYKGGQLTSRALREKHAGQTLQVQEGAMRIACSLHGGAAICLQCVSAPRREEPLSVAECPGPASRGRASGLFGCRREVGGETEARADSPANRKYCQNCQAAGARGAAASQSWQRVCRGPALAAGRKTLCDLGPLRWGAWIDERKLDSASKS
jgi:hypothetical protein